MDELDIHIKKLLPRYMSNVGHGRIWRRADRLLVRCGGHRLCRECETDRVELLNARNKLAKRL